MKKRILIFLWLLAGWSIPEAKSQHVNVSVNISSQPLWGPVGYSYVSYYYFPDYDIYYYVPSAQFIYWNGAGWIWVYQLPAPYASYDMYYTYKVVINKPRPYMYHSTYKVKYAGYKGYKTKQVVIRDSRNPKYYVVKGHPYHGKPAPARVSKPRKPASGNVPHNNQASPAKRTAPAPSTGPQQQGRGGGNKGGGGKGKGGGRH